MAGEADPKPSVRIERVGRPRACGDHRRERAAHLRRRHVGRQIAAKRHLREELKRAAAIRDRSADRREAAVRRDEAFEDRRVASRASRTRTLISFHAGTSSPQASSTSSIIGWMTKLL